MFVFRIYNFIFMVPVNWAKWLSKGFLADESGLI